jgi:large subunit ribosomal protein L31
MKANLHPQYFPAAIVSCACGNKFTTGSTVAEITTEICSNCHPFYTGKQNLIDRTGNVDRFRKRLATAVAAKAGKTEKKPRKSREATK